jgi:small-conductance mechanosensitive channel
VDPLSQAITIRVVLRTAPLERWSVSRELRRRILDAFRAREIQVPPRAVVTVAGGGAPQP